MSLVSSIFGGGEQKKGGASALSSLFDSSSVLPERPQHKAPEPVERPARTKEAPEKKRKRKEPKPTVEEEADTKPQDDAPTSLAEERTIFVGNLPLGTTRKSLAGMFKDCGKVETSRLRSIAASGVKIAKDRAGDQDLVKKVCANLKKVETDAKSSAQGYVVFFDKASVVAALALNNSEVAPNHRIRVDRSKPTNDATKSVFVGNLPYQADESTLRAHFCRGCGLNEDAGDVENVRIVRDKTTMQCKGFGYVAFKDKSMVAVALRKMHESTYKKRQIRVTVCGKRFKGRRGEAKPVDERSQGGKDPMDAVGALKRILTQEQKDLGKKRKRGAPLRKGGPATKANPAGLSRRQASEAKLEKRHKKLQKRAAKGMGKAKQGK